MQAAARLVERSPTAKAVGGPETIRKLPLMHRQALSAKIASELGKERAARACERNAVRTAMARGRFYYAASMARSYGLEEEAKEAARMHARGCMEEGHAHESTMRVAMEFGLKDEMKTAAGLLVDAKIERREYLAAARDAQEYGLEGRMQLASLKASIAYLFSHPQQFEAAPQPLTKEEAEGKILFEMRRACFDSAERMRREHGFSDSKFRGLARKVLRRWPADCLYPYLVAERFGLEEELDAGRMALRQKAMEEYPDVASLAMHCGLTEDGFRKNAPDELRMAMLMCEFPLAAAIAARCGLESEAGQIAAGLVNELLRGEDFETAAAVAYEYGLEEMRRAIHSIMRELRFC